MVRRETFTRIAAGIDGRIAANASARQWRLPFQARSGNSSVGTTAEAIDHFLDGLRAALARNDHGAVAAM